MPISSSILNQFLDKVHVFSVLLNVADGRPATRYLVAVDGGQVTTLEEIVKVYSEHHFV
jgi:hypothetical protein